MTFCSVNRGVRAAMVLAVVAVLGACAPVSAPGPGGTGGGGQTPVSGGTGEVGPAVNAYRVSRGRAALVAHPALAAAAQDQADYLAATGRTGHEGRGGSSVMQRVRGAGMQACLVAENLSFGYPGAAQAVAGWKGSSGHNRNMLLREATLYGEGQAGRVRVLVLARPC
ncbi:MAG: CAP domain-containing protein [Vannielia sp.]|uniref:CAP domain-containing protein n=1 Tax=Vannielia sp. TaxID=2813045 RepID=UPI003B8CED9E